MNGGGVITILGCGGSGGVPLAGNKWLNCDPNEPKNRRTRASIHVQYDNGKAIQIDTGPDFRNQVNQHHIKTIDAVIYTHSHADHVSGMDDLRYFKGPDSDPMPIYAMAETIDDLHKRVDYVFRESSDGLYKKVVAEHVLDEDWFDCPVLIEGCPMVLTRQDHGRMQSIGFKFGSVGYSTDVSGLDETALQSLSGIESWIIDCGQYGSDFVYAHPNWDVVRAWNEVVGAKRLILTHLTPRADYQTLCDQLPNFAQPAYDGLQIKFM